MNRFAFSLAALVAIFITFNFSIANDDRIRIRDWDFTWTVAESKEAAFEITKTDEALYCRLRSSVLGSMRLSPEDAAAIGKVIRDAGDEIDAIKGDKEKSVEQKAGKYTISFKYDPESGGSVYIRGADRVFGDTVYLGTRQAEDLGDAMVNAVKYAKAVDQRVDP